MELSGKIKVMFDTQRVSASFQKRELVLITPGRYPQQILIEFTQDKIGLLDRYAAGDEVRIQIDIRGREWNSPRGDTKYFVSIQGWRIEPLQAQHDDPGGGPPPFDDIPPPDSEYGGVRRPDDDIPF